MHLINIFYQLRYITRCQLSSTDLIQKHIIFESIFKYNKNSEEYLMLISYYYLTIIFVVKEEKWDKYVADQSRIKKRFIHKDQQITRRMLTVLAPIHL